MSRPFYNDVDSYVRELVLEQMGVATAEEETNRKTDGTPSGPETQDSRKVPAGARK